MKETIRVLLSEEEVDRRIKEVADQINRDYAGKRSAPDLRFKRRRILYVRAGKTHHSAGKP